MKNHKISLILPVFDESLVLKDIRRISTEFKKLNQDWETICIFDSKFKSSAKKLKLSQLPKVKILFYPLERFGKGFAFCYGFNQSAGDLVFFWEGNFTISPQVLLLYLNLMDLMKADIVMGSKRHLLSYVYYSPFRCFISKIYQVLIRILFGLNITDSQVGFKLFKREVLEQVIPKIIIKNWAFDLEILVLAHNLGFKRIVEAPIKIKKHFMSKGEIFPTAWYLLKDTLAIFYRKYILKYYQQEFV